MKTIKQILFASILMIAFAGCKKKEEAPKPVSNPIVYTSLNAEKSTLVNGGNTKITATATGEELTYIWAVDMGTIVGSGHQVVYNACCTGEYIITCEVKDAGNNAQKKSVTITVE